MDHQRVLITGCGGMLGNAIYPYFRDRCSHVLATDIQIEPDEQNWLSYLDARDPVGMAKAFADFKPDLVLHLAALVDVEICEQMPDAAKVSNADTAQIAAELCAKHNTTLVYISTGGIFDGSKGDYYVEDDVPNPIMVYGATKLDGEHEVRKAHQKAYIGTARLDGWRRSAQRSQVRVVHLQADRQWRTHRLWRHGQDWHTDLYPRFRNESVRAAGTEGLRHIPYGVQGYWYPLRVCPGDRANLRLR